MACSNLLIDLLQKLLIHINHEHKQSVKKKDRQKIQHFDTKVVLSSFLFMDRMKEFILSPLNLAWNFAVFVPLCLESDG